MNGGAGKIDLLQQFDIDDQPLLVQAEIMQRPANGLTHDRPGAVASHDPARANRLWRPGQVTRLNRHLDMVTDEVQRLSLQAVVNRHRGKSRDALAQAALEVGLMEQIVGGPPLRAMRCRGLALEHQQSCSIHVLHA